MIIRLTAFTDVVGFYFLNLATSYQPADDLAAFLAAGEPPIYIGYVYTRGIFLIITSSMTRFGSVVVDDAAAMTSTVFFHHYTFHYKYLRLFFRDYLRCHFPSWCSCSCLGRLGE